MIRFHRFPVAIAVLLAFAALAAIGPTGATAISDGEELATFGSEGSGAGELRAPGTVATDPVTGHVYTAEEAVNHRISEFTPWGKFVKAFGWDVAPGAVNEQQEVRIRAAKGQFKLKFGASPTTDLAFSAPGSESEGPESVEAALNALPSIGGAGGEVSVEAVPGTPDGKSPFIYVIAFKGALAGTNVDQLVVEEGSSPLEGGVPTSTFEARTRADGTAGGTGLESCTEESGCQAGLEGDGAGQFAKVGGLAVDAAGNLYAKELTNLRVQKFDSAGRFVLAFGSPGTAPGEFSEGFHRGIALGSSGQLFVADKERIQRFNLQGEFQASIPVPGQAVDYLASNPVGGDLYATFAAEEGVHKLDSITGVEIDELEGRGFLATDSAGNLFAAGNSGKDQDKVVQYDSSDEPLSPASCCSYASLNVSNLGTNGLGNLYIVSYQNFIRIYGPAPVGYEGPPQVPPTISAQFAISVGRDDATVAADINPHFWTNAQYYVEYGTGKCSEGGCESMKPLPPGTLLTSKVLAEPLQTAGIALDGLQPGTTYHYRFVAQSGGGGPVRGVGGEEGADGEESSFTTYPDPGPPRTDCPNQVFRIGPSAPLPDCRAYELVSPVNKNNGDIKALLDAPSYETRLSQSAGDGERFTYSSYRAFADPKAATYTNQYIATRDSQSGWSSESTNPAQNTVELDGSSFENPYKLFSTDLCTGWLVAKAEPVLAPGATPGYYALYRRDGCAGESHESLVQVEPPSKENFQPVLQGTSADGREAVFGAQDRLTDDAAMGPWQTYYAKAGQLRLICIRPDGTPTGGNCSAGTGPTEETHPERERLSSVTHAISDDGSRVYWTDSSAGSGPGKVYLRLNPGEEQSEISGGECSEAEMACTVKVSETISNKAARFLGASPDGGRALFEITEGAQQGNLYKFDLGAASSTLIATGGMGVAGTSEDLSHVYFASENVLPETNGATAGEPNLYLDQEGVKTFIATLSEDDVRQTNLSSTSRQPIYRAAKATADGRHLAFVSTERLTGYDNTDQLTGSADIEVYLYEAGGPGPTCISCNPGGARPIGRLVLANGAASLSPIAASLPTPENDLYSHRFLSEDGDRLFFNSFDALLPRDTNGKGDVYEWQAAGGSEECDGMGAELYVPSAQGCLSLISSGQSSSDSEFLDASEGGRDVFFTTAASLLPQDPGLVDIYDAREGGGFPPPPEPPGRCQGEACQVAPPPPVDPTPGTASNRGANSKPASRCRKGRVARKGRCVAKKRKRAKKQRKRSRKR